MQENARVQFSVKLHCFQRIVVNENQSQIAVNFVKLRGYFEEKTLLLPNHIQVTSSGRYQVKVSVSSRHEGMTTSIPVNTISLRPSFGKGKSRFSKVELNQVALDTPLEIAMHKMTLGKRKN